MTTTNAIIIELFVMLLIAALLETIVEIGDAELDDIEDGVVVDDIVDGVIGVEGVGTEINGIQKFPSQDAILLAKIDDPSTLVNKPPTNN